MTLYIKEITSEVRRTGRGLLFDELEQAFAAIRTLCELCEVSPADADDFVKLARGWMAEPLGYSGLLDSLSRGQQTLVPGPHFEHNGGLSRRQPLPDHEVRLFLDAENDGKPKLAVVNRDNSFYQLNRTECDLAAKLGRPRPIDSIWLTCTYDRPPGDIEFDLARLVSTIRLIDGLDVDGLDAQLLTDVLMTRLHGQNETFPPFIHTSGASLGFGFLSGFARIDSDSASCQNVTRIGVTKISGPAGDDDPSVGFFIKPGTAADDAVLALESALTSVLWSNNY